MTKREKYISTRNRLAVLALFLLCFLGAKAQTDYTGVYYIAGNGNAYEAGTTTNLPYTYNPDSPAANFYLRPAADPQIAAETDAFYDGTARTKPFITTNYTNHIDIALWFLEKTAISYETASGVDYYYTIQHVETGKYVVCDPFFSGTLGNDNDSRRKTMHLETNDWTDIPDKALFRIGVVDDDCPTCNSGGSYYFVPKLVENKTFKYLNLADRNQPVNYGTKADKYYGGLAGLYKLPSTNKIDVNSWFNFERYEVALPTITFNNVNNQVTITATECSIYYTTNGDEPTMELTPHTSPCTFTQTTPCTIKAIAVKSFVAGISISSEINTFNLHQVATPTVSVNSTTYEVTISCDTLGASIYYAIDAPPVVGVNPYSPFILSNEYSGQPINAIAVKEGLINSGVGSTSFEFPCATPVIRKTSATTFTITCSYPTSGVHIYYNTGDGNQADPTDESTPYSGEVIFNENELPFTVKAIAYAASYDPSAVAMQRLTQDLTLDSDGFYVIASYDNYETFVSMVNDSDVNAGASYKITTDIDVAAGVGVIDQFPFTGELKSVAKADGTYPVLSGLSHAIFETVYGGKVHNIMLKDVNVSGSGNVGAICNEAKGYSRIYSCGILPASANFPDDTHSSVTATGANGCAGGLVGLLDDDSRVVNCFSYADVYSSGYAAGIVGNNTFASDAEVEDVSGTNKYTHLRTMVVNCIYYGDIKSGSSIWPVYGGQKISNSGDYAINNYNFYSDSCHFASAFQDYNCSWPAKYDYLTRYEFLRYLLNSNRELCGWWVGAPVAPSTMATSAVQEVPKDASLMAKWVLDPSVAPFPILKPFGYYSSPINIDADASWRNSANKWEGKKLGTLSVTINPGTYPNNTSPGVSEKPDVDFIITDMDTIHGDYCYRKIQLPYYNAIFGNPEGETWDAKYGGNYKEYVVTGWEITETNGAEGTFTQDWETGYNFADRYCSKKDIYDSSTNPRIFAQGGYYYVPYDVTTITITAHWGNAIYLGNGEYYYDRVDFDHLYTSTNANSLISDNKQGTAFSPAGTRMNLANDKPIKTDKIATVAASFPNTGTVFDNALVLVGNHQYCTGGEDVNPPRSFTIMSADFDFDNEPDYCLDWQLGKQVVRQSFCPIRFDFLPVIEIGLCLKKDGSTQYYSLGCYRPLGHFEVTETALIRFGQFEFSNKNRNKYAPIILNGGIFEQYVKGTKNYAFSTADDKIDYIIIGGNVYIPTFSPGAHVNTNANFPTRHCAVNAIGGKFDELYLTGNYNNNITPNDDNPHCYIDGGWFNQVAAAGKEGIGSPTGTKGNVFFKINHSVIHEFYGGGTLDDKPVRGSIDVTIDSSLVNKYCGGPKFGDMYDGKTITTRATGTTFKFYYGGGNGGTSYVQYDRTDGEQLVSNYSWTNHGHVTENYYKPNRHRGNASSNPSNTYEANYDMNIINVSTGTDMGFAVFRTYFHSAQFSATKTRTINNTLTGCKVLKNFYGAGNLGGVEGNVTSELINSEVDSLAFGAGFSATIPTVTIYERDKSVPTIDLNTGIVTPQSGGSKNTYTWCYKDPVTGSVYPEGVVIPDGVGIDNPVFTNESDGKKYYYTTVPLKDLGAVTGNVTLILKGKSKVGTEGHLQTGNVFGGGDQSMVNGNTSVILQGGAHILGNVYGGGNEGEVSGNTSVSIENEE